MWRMHYYGAWYIPCTYASLYPRSLTWKQNILSILVQKFGRNYYHLIQLNRFIVFLAGTNDIIIGVTLFGVASWSATALASYIWHFQLGSFGAMPMLIFKTRFNKQRASFNSRQFKLLEPTLIFILGYVKKHIASLWIWWNCITCDRFIFVNVL